MFLSRSDSKRLFLSVFRIACMLGMLGLLSVNFLMASPQRPYTHEFFGPEFVISWAAGQKEYENVTDLFYAGNYNIALQKLGETIADADRFSKGKEKDAAILLTTKAQWLAFIGEPQESDLAFLRAQSLADRVLGTNHPIAARIQLVRAGIFLHQFSISEAKIALGRAIAAQDANHETNEIVISMGLRLQAMVHLFDGDAVSAWELLTKSSHLIEKVAGTKSALYGENQWLESIVASFRGEYERAIGLCESSLAILTTCYGPEHIFLVSVRNSLADAYQQAGVYEQASRLLKENLQTLEKYIGRGNSVIATTLNSLGGLHYRLGNYSQAETYFRQCLSVREKDIGVDSPAYASTVNNLAVVLLATDRGGEASVLFKDASLILNRSLGKNNPVLATVLLNWGMLSRRLDQPDIAKELLEEAIVIRDKFYGKNHPAVAEAAEAYAQLQCALGNFEHAERLAMLSFSIKTNFYGRDHPAMADNLSTLARIFDGSGDRYKAVEFYAKSAGIRAKAFGAEHPSVGDELEAAALVLCRAAEFEEAIAPLRMASSLQRDYLIEQASRSEGQDRVRLTEAMFYRTELFHSLCAQKFARAFASVPIQAAEQLASGKALMEEVQATRASLESDSRTSTKELREKLRSIQNQLDRLPENNFDPKKRDERRREMQSTITQIEETLAERNELLAQTIRERSLTLTNIAESLPTQSALVDFVEYHRYDFMAKTNRWKEQRYAAYLTFPLGRDSTNLMVERVDLGAAAPINEALGIVAERFSAAQYRARDVQPAMQKLSDLVYAPLSKYLTNASHLIICPDGQLSRLPFEMLPVGNKFLIEEKTISYVTSGREVVRVAANQETSKLKVQNGKSLVMGNPDFDFDLESWRPGETRSKKSENELKVSLLTSSPTRALSRDFRGLKFKPLLGAEEEAHSVAKLLGNDTTLRLGAEAREAELKAVKSPRVLHLATHGFFLTDQEFKQTNSLPPAWSATFTGSGLPKGGTPNDWENPLVRCGIALAP